MAYEIKIEKTRNSRLETLDFNNIPFGRVFSDHMFVSDYYDGAWHDSRIVPFENLSIHPATTALHYGQIIFEGLKAYKSVDNIPQMFRPLKNIERMNQSAKRMAMPEIPENLFMNALTELVSLDHDWIPTADAGASLYIRPFMFATDEYIGIKPADNFKFIIFTCPVQSYYSKPVKVWIEDKYVRAFPGGIGTAKAAGNYAATLYPVQLAREKGYDQILWLDGKEFKYVQEIGTMNVFFMIDGKVITPSLDSGTILEGITRNSVIQLLKERGIEVEERDITVEEVIKAADNGLLEDVFGTGTAATLSHISELGYKDREIKLPPVEQRVLSNELKTELQDIRTSKAPDPYNWIYKIESEVAIEDDLEMNP